MTKNKPVCVIHFSPGWKIENRQFFKNGQFVRKGFFI